MYGSARPMATPSKPTRRAYALMSVSRDITAPPVGAVIIPRAGRAAFAGAKPSVDTDKPLCEDDSAMEHLVATRLHAAAPLAGRGPAGAARWGKGAAAS